MTLDVLTLDLDRLPADGRVVAIQDTVDGTLVFVTGDPDPETVAWGEHYVLNDERVVRVDDTAASHRPDWADEWVVLVDAETEEVLDTGTPADLADRDLLELEMVC